MRNHYIILAIFLTLSSCVTNFDDTLAIYDLYFSFLNPFGVNWNDFEDPCDTPFDGLVCEEDPVDFSFRVTEINLSGFGVSGFLPVSIGSLTKLRTLDLSFNGMTGEIPAEIGLLADVEQIFLGDNQISGSVPPSIGGLNKLTKLYLGNNLLDGVIPSQIGSLKQLEEIDLSFNSIVFSVPSTVGNLGNLKLMVFANNFISGNIPTQIANLKNLETLRLEGNSITGTINRVTGCTGLKFLNLGGNRINGGIPSSIGNLTNLESLYAYNKEMKKHLEIINQITKHYQKRIINAPQVGSFLSGSFPTEMGLLTKLKIINLSGNKISGSLPPTMSALTSLVNMRLSSNLLSGNFPSFVTSFTNLEVLDLALNTFDGNLPTSLNNLKELRDLNVNNNFNLTGQIPDLSGLNKLVFIDLSYNKLTGQIPTTLSTLASLNSLSLRNNQLTGNVPTNLDFLDELLVQNNNIDCPVNDYSSIPLNDFSVLNNQCSISCPVGSNPCLNSGTCFLNNNSFACRCGPGFGGSLCQFAICPVSTIGDYNLPEGLEGTMLSLPCGVGYEGSANFTCESTGSWNSLITCADIDECLSDPCSIGATCVNSLGSFTCTCDFGFEGDGFNCIRIPHEQFTEELFPTAYWKFSDPQGIVDSTGNGNDLSPHGFSILPMFQEKNPLNKGVNIRGGSMVTAKTLNIGSFFSFQALFQANEPFQKAYHLLRLLPTPNASTNSSVFSILIPPNGKLSVYSGLTPIGSYDQRTVQLNRTSHVFIVYRRQQVAVWVDGDRVIFPMNVPPGDYYLSIGTRFMYGLIDEVAFFNRPFFGVTGFASHLFSSCQNVCVGRCHTTATGHRCTI